MKQFAHDIIELIKEQNIVNNIETDCNPASSSDGKYTASFIDIETDIGRVKIWPNFKKQSAGATIVKIGVINTMFSEGFTEEFIAKNGAIYGKTSTYSKNNVKAMAWYLTHKINPVTGELV